MEEVPTIWQLGKEISILESKELSKALNAVTPHAASSNIFAVLVLLQTNRAIAFLEKVEKCLSLCEYLTFQVCILFQMTNKIKRA